MQKNITSEIDVRGSKVSVMRIGNIDYISLTDLARYKNEKDMDHIIQNWMRTSNSIIFLGTWELLNNEYFKPLEFEGFKKEAGENSFVMTPNKWIKATNAIGIISKRGRYNGGTFAHPDIAFEFASWLSPEFKLYLIKEFERLKKDESYKQKVDWQATRMLSKINYLVHTTAIKNNIVPKLTEKQKRFVYQEEADVLNVALFGMTSKEWREKNPNLAKNGNIRDYIDLLHLVILSNIENINSELIKNNISQKERLIKLNEIARSQMKILAYNENIKNLERKRYELL